MKKILIYLIVCFMTVASAHAGSINTAAYKTMSAQSYRTNYRRNINNSTIPYWQAQSNYSTRNRIYQSYPNSVNNYSRNYRSYR